MFEITRIRRNGNVLVMEILRFYRVEKKGIGGLMEISQVMIQKSPHYTPKDNIKNTKKVVNQSCKLSIYTHKHLFDRCTKWIPKYANNTTHTLAMHLISQYNSKQIPVIERQHQHVPVHHQDHLHHHYHHHHYLDVVPVVVEVAGEDEVLHSPFQLEQD